MMFRKRESGFALLESLAGALVLVLVIFVGSKAFKNVIANHKEAAQLKALTDAVTQTAEKLSALSVATLTDPASNYLDWSQPQMIGLGPNRFRFHIVPKPSVSGVLDTTVVGLAVETGVMASGAFTASRSFATLIAPHLNSKDRLGQVSTAKERELEAAWYASLRQRLQDVATSTVSENQVRLNSYSCYDKGQCCPFMEKFFTDPKLRPTDGLDQKCLYRCALGGDVAIKDWSKTCGKDFCSLAPWKDKASCCAAIAAGDCKPGTVCANVCIECVGENGSTCTTTAGTCDGGLWNDFFDCANGTYCNGQPLPDIVPEWGDVKSLCKAPACAALPASCQNRANSCCAGYWQRLAMGEAPWPGSEVCATISKASECCDVQIADGYYNFTCSTSGTIVNALYYNKYVAYCGAPPGSDWDKYCLVDKGCPSTFQTPGTSSCGSWPGPSLTDPWIDPDPTSSGIHGFGTGFTGTATPTAPTSTPIPTTSTGSTFRDFSQRNGNMYNSKGGYE